ncbi:hypothetical protein D5S17_06665 [Pseudonocardiaceae bacterium YIM PH 21723]|nr:hypothetical protein D5S17_06665 [Pseudonocardiaceae bacterium YIM PH 21723]
MPMTAPGLSRPGVALLGTDPAAQTIAGLCGLPAHMVPVKPGDLRGVEAALTSLPAGIGTIFLMGAEPRMAAPIRALAGGIPVVTSQDVTAIVATAAALSAIAQSGRRLVEARVVIAGARSQPLLSTLLAIAGIRDITLWNLTDGPTFPLHQVARDTDLVIDLTDQAETLHRLPEPERPAVVTPDQERDLSLVLPGLLPALAAHPQADFTLNVHYACALALLMATPPDHRLPQPGNVLAAHITQTLKTQLSP